MEMTFRDLSAANAKTVVFPALPADGRFTTERAQNFSETGILRATPVVQIGASLAKRLTLPLELWGDDGEVFYRDHILPSYGTAQDGYNVHQVMVAWGNSSEDTFVGYPIGQAPTVNQLGAKDGEINLRMFDYVLVESFKPRVYRLPFVYTTVKGDTFLKICKQYGVLFSEVEKLNNVNGFKFDPTQRAVLIAGQKIKIPGGYQ